MRETLIIYSSTDGHTKNICERLSIFSNNTNAIKIISLLEENRSTTLGRTPAHCLRFAHPAEALRRPEAGKVAVLRTPERPK